MNLHRGLIYALIAAVLGVLLVVVPLFFVSAVETMEGYEYMALKTLSERMKALEKAYAPNYSAGLFVFTVGFIAAIIVYLLVKAKFSH